MRINREILPQRLTIQPNEPEKDVKNENSETKTPQNPEVKEKKHLISSSEVLDILEGKVRTTEKFADVKAEMDKNVPDRTTTIEEKELALSYIERLLKCSDITPELKTYWTNKKNVIEMEIQNIKNEQKLSDKEKTKDVEREFFAFITKYSESYKNCKTNEEKYENRTTFYNTYKSFLKRLKNCADLTEAKRKEYEQMERNMLKDIENLHKGVKGIRLVDDFVL